MNGAEVQALVERLRGKAKGTEAVMGWPYLMLQAADCIEGYQRALVAHHDIANVSGAVLERWARSVGNECPVCRGANERRD